MTRASTRRAAPVLALIVSSAVAGVIGCADSNVPFFTSPSGQQTTPLGFQNLLTGLISATRNNADFLEYILNSNGFGRQAANFTNTEPRFVTNLTGLQAISPSGFAAVWAFNYTNIAQAHQMLASIPNIKPAYTTAQVASITGIIQTIEALNYMWIAEDHDTLGAALVPAVVGTTPPPGFCNKDVWAYIVALLDTANVNLNTAGATPLPVKLPSGFAAVSAQSAPSTAPGAFAAFNRALAAKAGLQLAYAIARSSAGTAPTPTTAGAPDVAALTRADSALTASALYAPGSLEKNPTGGWAEDAQGVFFDFSLASGDATNPLNGLIGTLAVLNEVPKDQDVNKDLRWLTKFAVNPNQVQQPSYAFIASPYIYSMYPSPGSPLPIVRNEELTLIGAQIQLGLGNTAAAANLVDQVRMTVGGLPSGTIPDTVIRVDKADTTKRDTTILAPVNPGSYTSVRDFLLREQQISTILEATADHSVSLRMYDLAAVLDTTWNNPTANPPTVDLHTTVDPIPFAEISARGGTFPISCP